MRFVKVLGIGFVVLSCTFAGFLKSRAVIRRKDNLADFCSGLEMLYEYISQGLSGLETALDKAFFKCDFLSFDGNAPIFNDCCLTPDEKTDITNFFKETGHSAKKFDLDRINAFKTVMTQHYNEALAETKQKCKLWQTGGICIGLIVGILLI